MKELLKISAVALILLFLSLGLIACGGEDTPEPDPTPSGPQEYTVTVKSEYGLPLSAVYVLVHDEASPYPNSTVKHAETDRDGRVSFELDSALTYSFRLVDLPLGYIAEEKYYFDGRTAELKIPSAPIDGDHREVGEYSVGDIVHNLSLTTVDGVEYTASDILKENDLLILNFWFTGCPPCRAEFPGLIEAYGQYKDKGVELIAIDDNGDPVSFIRNYTVSIDGVETKLPFPVVKADDGTNGYGTCELITKFGGTAYPTTVFIDRAGMIAYAHYGMISEAQLASLIEHFTAENYVQGTLGK